MSVNTTRRGAETSSATNGVTRDSLAVGLIARAVRAGLQQRGREVSRRYCRAGACFYERLILGSLSAAPFTQLIRETVPPSLVFRFIFLGRLDLKSLTIVLPCQQIIYNILQAYFHRHITTIFSVATIQPFQF